MAKTPSSPPKPPEPAQGLIEPLHQQIAEVIYAETGLYQADAYALPARILDLSPVFRNLTNGLSTPEGKGLLGALRYYGLDAIGAKLKDDMRNRILQGWPFTPEEQRRILEYCDSDVDALCRLLPRILLEMKP